MTFIMFNEQLFQAYSSVTLGDATSDHRALVSSTRSTAMPDSFPTSIVNQPSGTHDHCQSLEEFGRRLEQIITAVTLQEHSSVITKTVTLSANTLLPVTFPPESHRRSGEIQRPQGRSLSVRDLCTIADSAQRRTWQRGAARSILTLVQEVDGFRYTFNNRWASKDDDGDRFSYTCLDSLENKDRQANNPRRGRKRDSQASVTTEQRGARKETYNCKGQVTVKYSGARQTVEVVYRHLALHDKVTESPSAKRSMAPCIERDPSRESVSSRETDVVSATPSLHDSVAAGCYDLSLHSRDTPTLPDAKRRKLQRGMPRLQMLDTSQISSYSFPDDHVSLAELLRRSEDTSATSPPIRRQSLLSRPSPLAHNISPGAIGNMVPSSHARTLGQAPTSAYSNLAQYASLPYAIGPSAHSFMPMTGPQHHPPDHRVLGHGCASDSGPWPTVNNTQRQDLLQHVQNRQLMASMSVPNAAIPATWYADR